MRGAHAVRTILTVMCVGRFGKVKGVGVSRREGWARETSVLVLDEGASAGAGVGVKYRGRFVNWQPGSLVARCQRGLRRWWKKLDVGRQLSRVEARGGIVRPPVQRRAELIRRHEGRPCQVASPDLREARVHGPALRVHRPTVPYAGPGRTLSLGSESDASVEAVDFKRYSGLPRCVDYGARCTYLLLHGRI